jgi:hypothetical protein
MNIADDFEYLNQSDYFLKMRSQLYEIDETEDPFANFGSRRNRNRIEIHNNSEISQFSIENLEEDENKEDQKEVAKEELLYEKEEKEEEISDDESNNSEINYTSDEGESEEDDEEDDEDDELDKDESEEYEDVEDEESDNDSEEEHSEGSEEPCIFAYIKNFPIQMICLEKCKGTFDELLSKGEIDESTGAAALFQITITLLAYQKAFHFTHNDLHTNNIMYVETNEEFLYYKFDKKIYKVPTYGKIFKVIDFGRSIYKLNGKIYCSDSFDVGGDASTQYNCEPYLNKNKPRLEPNFSFDLCRLGCSIFDFILDEDFNESEEEFDDFQRTVIRWCSDDNGKNVLYKKNGDERYPNFKLYKMIARTVNKHDPISQLSDPYFSQFLIKNERDIDKIIDLDSLPCYV